MPTVRVAARPRNAPHEFIIVVGGPSNTFNGYAMISPINAEQVPMPKPTSLEFTPIYIGRGFDGNPLQVFTHDLYWGNFIEPVHRLFTRKIITPAPGDLVTVIVYMPPYRRRLGIDWEVSPHNPVWFRASPWVTSNPYDPSVRRTEQGRLGLERPSLKPIKKSQRPLTDPQLDRRIDHEILMLTTNPNTSQYIKRPARDNHYLDIIHDLPRRCVLGRQDILDPTAPTLLDGILVKLLLLEDESDMFDYFATGAWSGKRALHLLDARTEAEVRETGIFLDSSWDFHARGRPPRTSLRFWNDMPSVDRRHVKIKRLDYFGHSTTDAWFLQYGTLNDKGEEATGEVEVSASDLLSAFRRAPQPLFAPDAEALLWGCHLGDTSEGTAMAQELVTSIPRVIAADSATDYAGVATLDDRGMPLPVDGGHFREFTR